MDKGTMLRSHLQHLVSVLKETGDNEHWGAVQRALDGSDEHPDPAPGTGRYYVTAVTYQGQTRYGRKANGGLVSGRDPAVLPACQ